MITLDGVMQSPGAPEEDISNGFKYGGWTVPYYEESFSEVLSKELSQPFDLLLGRKTYDLFASYWPGQGTSGTVAGPFNKATKYVVSNHQPELTWEKSELIDGDAAQKLKELKQQDGPMLQVHGSGKLVQTLLKNYLVDELWLRIFPITLGQGQKLFEDGTIPISFELTESTISPTGVILANYKRAGEVKTGTFG